MADKRLILAVAIDDLPGYFGPDGFFRMTENDTIGVLDNCETWFGPREVLEEFDAFRQVIPYVLIKHKGAILAYTRTPKAGESRLHGKVSIGLGGHIDLPDAQTGANGHFDISGTIYEGVKRELKEELGLEDLAVHFEGLLALDATSVDRVHLGVICVVELAKEDLERIQPNAEEGLAEVRLVDPAELHAEADRLENWTKVLLPHLSRLI